MLPKAKFICQTLSSGFFTNAANPVSQSDLIDKTDSAVLGGIIGPQRVWIT